MYPPLQYADYSCDQIKSEMLRVSSKVKSLTGELDENKENDQMITGAGLILFWPALFFIGGTKEQEAEYARLKGEYEALDKVAEDNAQSRISLGVHFPEDVDAGRDFSKQLIDRYITQEPPKEEEVKQLRYKDLPAPVYGMEGY